MSSVFFFIAGIGAVCGAVGVVMVRNPFYAVLALVSHLLSLAALFLLLEAQFVAAAQVVVYAGAVMVLYVFVVAYVGGSEPAQLRAPVRRDRRGGRAAVGHRLHAPAEHGDDGRGGRRPELARAVRARRRRRRQGAAGRRGRLVNLNWYLVVSTLVFVMVVAACEVCIGLGLVVAIFRRRLPIDVDEIRELHG